MPITAILIPVADCVLLLHQLVIGPVTIYVPRLLSQKSVQTLQEKSVQTEKIPYFFST